MRYSIGTKLQPPLEVVLLRVPLRRGEGVASGVLGFHGAHKGRPSRVVVDGQHVVEIVEPGITLCARTEGGGRDAVVV